MPLSRASLTLILCLLELVLLQPTGWAGRKTQAFQPELGSVLARGRTRAERRRLDGPPLDTSTIPRGIAPVAQRELRTIASWKQQEASLGLSVSRLLAGSSPYPLFRIDVPAQPAPIRANNHRAGERPTNVVMILRQHGDELGALGGYDFLEQVLKQKGFRHRFNLTVLIKVDPFGTRLTPDGRDLNRCYLDGAWTDETRAIGAELARLKPDVLLDLHEDYETAGFVVVNESPVRSERNWSAIARGLSALPRAALQDTSRPDRTVGPLVNPDYAMCFPGAGTAPSPKYRGGCDQYAAQLGIPYVLTLEAPGRIPLRRRQQLTGRLIESLLSNIHHHGLDRR